MSEDAIAQWYEPKRVFDGTGSSKLYSDLAILTCHELRQVFKLPLRQCQGFVDSLFHMMNIPLQSPNYSVLSRRLSQLGLKVPFYRNSHKHSQAVFAIAIDSTGLSCFSENQWQAKQCSEKTKKN